MADIEYTGEVGCLVAGHRGQYAHLEVIRLALAYGWQGPDGWTPDDIAAAVADYESGDADREIEPGYPVFEATGELANDAETWLNDHVAADGFVFYWETSEFFYGTIAAACWETWNECRTCGGYLYDDGTDWRHVDETGAYLDADHVGEVDA